MRSVWKAVKNKIPLRNLPKNTVRRLLEYLAKIKLKRTTPLIVAITGSFGKTSTKDAVYEVLKKKWAVLKSSQSLNTEIGLSLAILEQPSGFSSPIKWMGILLKAVLNAFKSRKIDFLILEYGADKPGDISNLISVAKPDIAIITSISRVHQANGQFKDINSVFEEKKKLATCLAKADSAILNYSDPLLKSLENQLDAKTFWFAGRDIHANNFVETQDGFTAIIHSMDKKINAHFPIVGSHHINIILPALLCGILNGITLEEGIAALQKFQMPPGRMSLIKGENGAILLDSTYNASPETVKLALNTLHRFPAKRKIAVLGNMNELGEYAEKAHREVAHKLGVWLDMLITVGAQASIIADEALKKGFAEAKIKVLLAATEVPDYLRQQKLGKGDAVLFKGSQNKVRLEKAVKALMENPSQAKKLLCRQEPVWENID